MKDKNTFVLEVNNSSSHNWIGQIEWIQGSQKQSFRSVMELLQLIDSVVSSDEKTKVFEDAIAIGK